MTSTERSSARPGAQRRGVLLAALLPVLAASACTRAPGRPSRPNILLITVDTLRADHLSSYGYERETSPFLDALAARGVRFEHAYATSSWTTPSVVSMLTSTYQNRHGMGARLRGAPTRWNRIPEDLPSLPEALQRGGYRTLALVANANLAADRGFDRGFDRYECLGTADVEQVGPALEPFLDEIRQASGPWFFWLHLLDPHGPYRGREPWIDEFAPDHGRYPALDGMPSERFAVRVRLWSAAQIDVARALYDSEIRAADEFLRQLFERLPATDDAFVLFAADHGEEFRDHGELLHGRTLYEESIRIPLILRLPGDRLAGTVAAQAVSLIDVLPTILGAAGLEPEPGAAGADLIGADGVTAPEGRFVVAELLRGRAERATSDGRWKFILKESDEDHPQLFNLARDPFERSNLASRKASLERMARYRELLEAFELAHAPSSAPVQQTEVSPEQLEALRALGYVGSD